MTLIRIHYNQRDEMFNRTYITVAVNMIDGIAKFHRDHYRHGITILETIAKDAYTGAPI